MGLSCLTLTGNNLLWLQNEGSGENSAIWHVFAISATELLALDAVFIPIQLGVACLVRGNSLSTGLEGGAALGPSSPGAENQNPKPGECGDGGRLHGKKAY
jgi:hypothetical protein